VPAAEEDLDLDLVEADITLADAEAADAMRTTARLRSEMQQRAKFIESKKRLDHFVQNLSTLRADFASLNLEIDGGIRKNDQGEDELRAGLKETLETTRELIENAQKARHILTCPGCDSALRFNESGEDLELADPDDQNFQMTDEELANNIAALDKGTERLAELEKAREKVGQQIAAAENSTQHYQELQTKLEALPTIEKVQEAEKVERELIAKRDDLFGKRERARLHAQRVEDREKAIKTASEAHKSFLAWTLADQALEPGGIPGELLGEALGALNSQLRSSAALAGWPYPIIDREMQITRSDGLLYSLLSESAQWRMRAVIADVISSRSGTKLLVLDRLDMLDLTGRAQFLKWAQRLAEDEYDTILVMATLKERPQTLPKAIEVHWLENGAEVELKQGDAA
jgi:hemoglobin-like flavoprotein